MQKETRTVCYDNELEIEIYRLQGIVKPFPNHFHDYYVIGLVESGSRSLKCNGKEYTIESGDILIFNPEDSHGCIQSSDDLFDYIGINISKEIMLHIAEDLTGNRSNPKFQQNVIKDKALGRQINELYTAVLSSAKKFEKEEMLYLMTASLIEKYGQAFHNKPPACRAEIKKACRFMNKHYDEHITLDTLCKESGLSKSTLLREFTKSKGVTPYRYLQAIRIGKAKKMLEAGEAPIDAALKAGFSDQSHFSNAFNHFIGLSPAAYRQIFFNNNEE